MRPTLAFRRPSVTTISGGAAASPGRSSDSTTGQRSDESADADCRRGVVRRRSGHPGQGQFGNATERGPCESNEFCWRGQRDKGEAYRAVSDAEGVSNALRSRHRDDAADAHQGYAGRSNA
jgi:hypothetical protein